MIKSPKKELMEKLNVLFVRDSCQYCAMYYFIETFNLKLPVEKRIKVINCASYDKWGIPEDYLITLYAPYFDRYPALFLGNGSGKKPERHLGANTSEELKIWLTTWFAEELEEEVPFEYKPNCKFKKTMFGKAVICE